VIAASLLTEACGGDSAKAAVLARRQYSQRVGREARYSSISAPSRSGLRLGLRLALDSHDVLGAGLLLGLAGGDALRGLVRTGLEFVQPGSAVTWLAEVSGGFFVRLGFRLTRDGL